MIRDKDKVYGECNDPNTVIATSFLEEGKPVVGAGNHGVKTAELDSKSLLHTDGEGKLVGFNHNFPNKIICTDGNGGLILADALVIQGDRELVPVYLTNPLLEVKNGEAAIRFESLKSGGGIYNEAHQSIVSLKNRVNTDEIEIFVKARISKGIINKDIGFGYDKAVKLEVIIDTETFMDLGEE